MDILAAALAFAITMLVLAMTVSAFVEIIHRLLSMRESGLQYMLAQIFDQVLSRYVKREDLSKLVDASQIPAGAKTGAEKLLEIARTNFVERMSTNRAPMGVPPDATPTDSAAEVKKNPWWQFGLWNGRDLTSLTPAEFMERLGSIDIGDEIKKANDRVNKLAGDAGTTAANAVDVVLKDVAQKFEAFGKEASAYFEGRARLLSVAVAVVLAFAVHVDAIELFNTFLRNPNVRENVIGKMDAVTKQFQEVQAKLDKPPAAGDQTAQQQAEQARKAVKDTIDQTRQTISDLAALGVPIGWSDAHRQAAQLRPILWNCPHLRGRVNLWGDCANEQDVWLEAPSVFRVYLYLLIGGLLIGLGGPFWYRTVSGLTSIRNVASSVPGTAAAPADGQTPVVPARSKESQPVTPVDVFKVAHRARSGVPEESDAPPDPKTG